MPSRKSADASTSIVPASEHDDSTARPPAATAASNGVGIEVSHHVFIRSSRFAASRVHLHVSSLPPPRFFD